MLTHNTNDSPGQELGRKLLERSTISKPQPLVSVLTPVHNGEPFLRECIESVLNQTYINWEYIIVNNCSTDRTLDIAQEYAAKDPRVRIHNNIAFLPQLRNFNHALGLVSPRGVYCKMVQADDWLFPECLERMVRMAEEHPSVGLVSSYRLQGTRVSGDGLAFSSKVVSGREVCRRQLKDELFVFGSPTTLLIRGDVVRSRQPFFKETMLHADTDACYEILREWDLGFVHQVLTFSRIDNESISSAVRNLHPHELDKFISLTTHGRTYLNPDEFDVIYRCSRRRYYQMLASQLFYPGARALYKYHRTGLKTVNYDLSLLRLASSILNELLDMALTPKSTATKQIKALKRLLRTCVRRWRSPQGAQSRIHAPSAEPKGISK